jgi:3-deoxy-manno-octulosonate cytidylyltransferase (CMP-KDO synthetase)
MAMNSTAIVIPARYASGRFPGKPLVEIAGVPMIERTYRRCALAFPSDRIYVATDDDRIGSFCRSVGIQTVMTSENCLTGTDRVAEAAKVIDADFFINVQGDEPILNPDDILVVHRAAVKFPGEVLNGYCRILDDKDFRNPSLPKVVFAPDGRLLYMSRAAVPTSKRLEFVEAWRQICIYGFTREALKAFTAAPQKTPAEAIEDIEILRFLELGIPVRMVEVSDHSYPVDNPSDVSKILDKLELG